MRDLIRQQVEAIPDEAFAAIRASAWQSSQSTHAPYAGSSSVVLGSSIPTDAVIVDWCAPPSGARVTPEGVPATTKREPE